MLRGEMTDVVRTPEEALRGLPDFPFASHYRELNGLRLAHLDEGDGPPVVFLHGAGHFLQEDQGPLIGGLVADWLLAS
jgi:hypothetical protein